MRMPQMNRNYPTSQTSQQGVVLLESLIAVLIFSLGILAIAGLQAAMLKNTSDAKYRAEAAFIAQQRLGVMWADPTHLTVYALGTENIADLLPNGTRTVTLPVVGNGEVKVEIKWQLPGQALHNYTTYARITGGD
ncbi:MAG: prepilin-type cleavage/methylation domain-containing protein [Methylotenera sp.]|nr:prepilin-type cleavage/methylation domain-containing protein [Methylotenera sp.]